MAHFDPCGCWISNLPIGLSRWDLLSAIQAEGVWQVSECAVFDPDPPLVEARTSVNPMHRLLVSVGCVPDGLVDDYLFDVYHPAMTSFDS